MDIRIVNEAIEFIRKKYGIDCDKDWLPADYEFNGFELEVWESPGGNLVAKITDDEECYVIGFYR